MVKKTAKNQEQPLTARGFLEVMHIWSEKLLLKEDAKHFLTKEDAKHFLTKEDAKHFLTKEDAKHFATKEDLMNFKDAILGELKAIREEQTVGAYQLADRSDRIEKLENIHPGNTHKMGLNHE